MRFLTHVTKLFQMAQVVGLLLHPLQRLHLWQTQILGNKQSAISINKSLVERLMQAAWRRSLLR
jgi:hypothetical protein